MAISGINASGSSDTSSVPQSQLYGSSDPYGLTGIAGGSGGSAVATPTAATGPTALNGTGGITAPAGYTGATPEGSSEALPSYSTMATGSMGLNGPTGYTSGAGTSPLNLDPGFGSGSTATTGASAAGTAATAASGLNWGSLLSGLGSVLSNPAFDAATLAGLGEYEASQAQSQTAALTSQLTGPSQPLIQNATGQLGAIQQGLTGAPVTGGAIGQSEQAAQNLGSLATQYSTGQLTPAQQQQIQQNVQAQQQQISSQLASQGITDSSVIAMYDQQIQNNATQQTQQLIQGNTTLAQNALQGVQSTYSSLISNAVSEFGAGMGPVEDAVNITLQQNTQLAAGLQSLFGSIAKAFTSSGGTSGGGQGGSGSGAAAGATNSLLNQVGSAVKNALSPSSSTNAATGVGSQQSGSVDLGTTDFSSQSLFGTATPGYDVGAQTGITPAFDTGYGVSGDATGALGDVGGSDLTSLAADTGSDVGDVGDLLGDFSSAGGQAAAGAGAAADTGADVAASAGGAGSGAAGAGASAAAGVSALGLGLGAAAFLSPFLVPSASNAANDPQLESQLAQGNASTLFGTQTGEQANITNVSGQGYVMPNAPSASQTYAFLPGDSGYYGYVGGATPQNPNATGEWYLPGPDGTVMASQSQYDTLATDLGNAQAATAGSSAAVDAGGTFTDPTQSALQDSGFSQLLASLQQYTGSGSPFGPTEPAAQMTPQQQQAYQQALAEQSAAEASAYGGMA
jgi:hypothetical protein